MSFRDTPLIKHGHAREGRKTRIYKVWRKMISRCTNPRAKDFHWYGSRGISVCERWLDFSNFLCDMGVGKSGWSIERVNISKGYNPDNVCWATQTRQNRNSRHNLVVTVRGRTGCRSELCEHFHLKYELVRKRLKLGWEVEQAFFAPLHFRREHVNQSGVGPSHTL